MEVNTNRIDIELSVDWLTENGMPPYLKFIYYCYQNNLIEFKQGNPIFHVDVVWLIPSENMYKNVEVWKMLDRHGLDWDDRDHIPEGPWEYDEYIECYEAQLEWKRTHENSEI